jgi:Family of unknown function (DUF6510)
MTSSDLGTDGNALDGHVHDVFRVDVTTAVGRCTECGRTGPMAEVRVFDHAPAWSPAVRCATRSSCGWSAVPAAPGWTCVASPTCSFRCRTRPEPSGWWNVPRRRTGRGTTTSAHRPGRRQPVSPHVFGPGSSERLAARVTLRHRMFTQRSPMGGSGRGEPRCNRTARMTPRRSWQALPATRRDDGWTPRC